MPELPEVEAARRALAEHCVGRKIVKCVAADDEKVIDGVSPRRLEAALLGRTIVDARRKGKNLWLALDAPPSPSFQFGMTGAIYIKGVELTKYKRSAVSPSEEWPLKYSKLFVELDDGLEFSFTDKRRFAKIRLLDNPEGVSPISELGPDALFEPMQLDDFVQSLSRKNVPIKALLLDQSFISGLGNWVGDEVLYQARIHPMLSASKIPKEKCETLHQCIKEVIEKALEAGADSSQFPKGWIFHSREKKPNNAFVDGKKIDFITVGGRTSAFVPELQKLDGIDASASRSRRGKDRGMDDDSKSKTGRNARKKGKKEAKKGTVDDVEEEEKEKKPVKKTKTRVSKSLSNIAVKTHGNDHKGDNEVEEAIPVERGRNQPAKVAKRKAFNTNDDNNKQEDTKPVKRGRKQAGKAPRGSSKTAVYTNDDGIEDEEEVPPAKRGRKQSVKVAKSSSKKADDIIADDDEVAEDETEAKPVKRGKGQSAKVAKSSSKKE